ncbi:hypothetical protein AX15_007227 [Amanita polypyramis BW_CC]|nr:hypothetical protein AX15_007227 [Amanita polypyramis BW_CC]
MALSTSPRKTIPLASGDSSRPRSRSSAAATTSLTKRVFFCAVVVEGSENGRRLPEEIQELVLSFGNPLSSNTSSDMLSSAPGTSLNESEGPTQRKRAMTDTSGLQSVINELVASERSYVKRLQILKNDYADPLRNFARSKETAILPAYEAKTLFGNIDNLLPVNEAFLTDLEKMMTPYGPKTVGGVGDVALRHFKELRGFEQYKQYYIKREEAQAIFEREVSKRSSRFGAFIDHIKYQSADARNRVGLRELLMEPVQRIPRYTLLFRTMLKHMSPDDPQQAKLAEADEIASKIALAEADEETKRAAIFYCLSASIEGFPPELFSSSRRFIDCIDVEDVLNDAPLSSAASSTSSSATSLHCTLFLFDDKILIAKRPGNGERCGRTLAGLDDLDKVTKASGIPSGKKKSGMTCKGVVDVTEVVATDVGGADFHLYLENPLQDQSDRWSGRPFRCLSAVHPFLSPNLDPTQMEADKQRFLEHLWRVQAMYRTKAGQSVVLCAKEQEVECKAGKTTYARTYYNVYQRIAFLQEQKKTKIVVHIDSIGSADPIPFGVGGPPFARIRLQPMAGGLCRFVVSSNDPNDESEEDIVQTERVPSRIVQTIHQFGLFQFRTGRESRPSTPTARSRVAIFGLDAISRNIFSSRPGSAMGDFFGGSINSHRRTKSTTSRSSMYAHTASTADGSLMKFSHRSNSTAATTVSSIDDDDFFASSKSSRTRQSTNRGKSPLGNSSDSEKDILSQDTSRYSSRAVSREATPEFSDGEVVIVGKMKELDTSDWDLAMKLELARQNSMNQHGNQPTSLVMEIPVEDTIYEEGPPASLRPGSRSSHTPRPSTPQSELETPSISRRTSPSGRSRSLSQSSSDRRPLGPRSPSPLPRIRSPTKSARDLPHFDDEVARDSVSDQPSSLPSRFDNLPTGIPRSKRQPFFPSNNADATPKSYAASSSTVPSTIEPLSIKKKSSTRSTTSALGSPTPARRTYVRNSPLSRPIGRIISPRRVPSQVRRGKPAGSLPLIDNETSERLVQYSQSIQNDIQSSRRSIKRIKIEMDELHSPPNLSDSLSRSPSPDKSLRSSQPNSQPLTKAAQERMKEMRQVIGLRQGEQAPRSRPRSAFDSNRSPLMPTSDKFQIDRLALVVDDLTTEADSDLDRALSYQEKLQDALRKLVTDFREKAIDLERTKLELQNLRRQCELTKHLLADATAEKEIMYEAFNEELDGMYNDVNLPDDEAWVAITADLRQTKEARNALSKENSQLKRHIAEIELERDEWGKLLRTHGLLP